MFGKAIKKYPTAITKNVTILNATKNISFPNNWT